MPRFAFDQGLMKEGDREKSCGAAAAMVTLAELGLLTGAEVNRGTAKIIYNQIQKAPGDESPAGKMANYLIHKGCAVEILINKDLTKALIAGDQSGKLGKAYAEHKLELKGKNIKQVKVSSFTLSHLDGNARLILVGILPAEGAAHNIVLRKDGDDLWIMNPDGGKDEKRKDTFIKFLNEAGKQKDIGGVDYIFSGIVLRVTKA